MLCPSRWEPAWRLHTNSYNLGKTFLRISRTRNIPLTWILASCFLYIPPFISQILDFIYRTVLIFFLSILNGVTLKTSERDFSWRLYRRRKARKGKGKGVSKGAGVFVFCPPISLTNPITSIVNRWPITSRGASRHGPNLLTFFYTGNCQVVQLSPYKPFRVFRSSFKSAYDFVENLRVQLIKFFE